MYDYTFSKTKDLEKELIEDIAQQLYGYKWRDRINDVKPMLKILVNPKKLTARALATEEDKEVAKANKCDVAWVVLQRKGGISGLENLTPEEAAVVAMEFKDDKFSRIHPENQSGTNKPTMKLSQYTPHTLPPPLWWEERNAMLKQREEEEKSRYMPMSSMAKSEEERRQLGLWHYGGNKRRKSKKSKKVKKSKNHRRSTKRRRMRKSSHAR